VDAFEHAKTLGSLIQVSQALSQYLAFLPEALSMAKRSGDIYARAAADDLLPLIPQAQVLAMQFDAVVANPPYMGGKGMNPILKEFARITFPETKSDLFAMFIDRGTHWCKPNGLNCMVTMQSWMFLSSYESMREKLLQTRTLQTMAHLGPRAFTEISGEVVQTTAFVLQKNHVSGFKPVFFRLVNGHENDKQSALRLNQNRFESVAQDDFKKIPGSPLAYWVSSQTTNCFDKYPSLASSYPVRSGIMTGNDPIFLRLWHEVSLAKIGFGLSNALEMKSYWYPLSKGGDFRKWYGNNEHVINLRDDGWDIKNGGGNYRLREKDLYFKPYITWSRISSAQIAFRFLERGVLFADAAPGIFAKNQCLNALAFLNSKLCDHFLKGMNPTLNFQTNALVSG
jgi:hypothetical protein